MRLYEFEIKRESIKWWSNYAQARIFNTPEEARDWIFNGLEREEKRSHAAIFGIKGPEYNREFANSMPVYQAGKKWKIGRPIRKNTKFKTSDLEIKPTSFSELNKIGESNFNDFDIIKGIKKWKMSDLGISNDDYYFKSPDELPRIRRLANTLKENGWFEAIVVGTNVNGKDPWVIEGQHRIRALLYMGFKTVPGHEIRNGEDH